MNYGPLHFGVHQGTCWRPPDPNSGVFFRSVSPGHLVVVFCVVQLCFCFGFNLQAERDKVAHILSAGQGQWRARSTHSPKLENLLVLIWILNRLWGAGRKTAETAFWFCFCFPSNVLLSLLVCTLCFLSSHTKFSLIPTLGQAQSTSLGLVLTARPLTPFGSFSHGMASLSASGTPKPAPIVCL